MSALSLSSSPLVFLFVCFIFLCRAFLCFSSCALKGTAPLPSSAAAITAAAVAGGRTPGDGDNPGTQLFLTGPLPGSRSTPPTRLAAGTTPVVMSPFRAMFPGFIKFLIFSSLSLSPYQSIHGARRGEATCNRRTHPGDVLLVRSCQCKCKRPPEHEGQ